jgi:hypothetical protein
MDSLRQLTFRHGRDSTPVVLRVSLQECPDELLESRTRIESIRKYAKQLEAEYH